MQILIVPEEGNIVRSKTYFYVVSVSASLNRRNSTSLELAILGTASKVSLISLIMLGLKFPQLFCLFSSMSVFRVFVC